MSNQTIELRQGTGEAWLIDLRDEDTSEPLEFVGEEPLECRVWAGDDQSTLVSPSVTWQDAPNGVVGLSLSDEDTRNLEPGRYYLVVTLKEAGLTREIFSCWLRILPSPGNAPPLPTYCSYEDLLRLHPTLDKEQVAGVQAGFAEARHQARQWIDAALLRRDAGNRGFNAALPDAQLWLETDKLMVTPRVVEIAARKALSIIFGSAFSPNSKDNDKYVAYASRQESKANNLLYNTVFELDTNSDGIADYWIECNKVSVRGYKGWW